MSMPLARLDDRRALTRTPSPARAPETMPHPQARRATPRFVTLALVGLALLAAGCAGTIPQRKDLSAFEQARPASILVLPPVNESVDVLATAGVFSQLTLPLAESGYYVPAVSVVDQTLRANGVQTAAEAHAIDPARLREVFGTDAALYTVVRQYGSTYKVVASDAVVVLHAQIRDLRTGELLWQGQARASSAEQRGAQQGGLAAILVRALVEQILDSMSDRSHAIAGIASDRLLRAGMPEGVPPGPRARVPKTR
jgi:hypothetical protein